MHRLLASIVLGCSSLLAWADLRPLAEDELGAVSGQDGISLSASVTFNANPGLTRCAGGCGARIAINPGRSAGFIIIDNIKGTFSFDGVTLDIVKIDSGFNGEGAQFNGEALRIGLREARFTNAQYSLSGANQASQGAGLQQHDLFTYQVDGAVRLQGNLYVFPAP
jgi:hypothetical protein